MKGVCDTPLHLFDYFMGITMVIRGDFALGAAQNKIRAMGMARTWGDGAAHSGWGGAVSGGD